MPFTVITLSKVPLSLRGDLTKWMQEISSGVYVGNFNTRIREKLWLRVMENIGTGEATMSYAYPNEIGYQFKTFNTKREAISYDGIPLVLLPNPKKNIERKTSDVGFSDAAKFRKAKKYGKRHKPTQKDTNSAYVVVDIITDGLDYKKNRIIEVGAVKSVKGEISSFQALIAYEGSLPSEITNQSGITEDLLVEEGKVLEEVLKNFKGFIQDLDIVEYKTGYALEFLNENFKRFNMNVLENKVYSLIKYVKREKMSLKDYKLETALVGYNITNQVTYRALENAKLIYQLSTKVNKFLKVVN